MKSKEFDVDTLANMLDGTTLTIQQGLDIVFTGTKEKDLNSKEMKGLKNQVKQCEICRVWYAPNEFSSGGKECNYCNEYDEYED